VSTPDAPATDAASLDCAAMWRRCSLSLKSAVAGAAWSLGPITHLGLGKLATDERLDTGLVVVLPGIEGASGLNANIARGLDDGGVRSAVIVHDWTTGYWPLAITHHLRGGRRNRERADAIAQRIVEYQDAHPGRPVHVIGHSGGAAMAAWTLEALPDDRRVTAAMLLAPALSPRYDLTAALRRTGRLINYHSTLDLLHLTLGTLAFGNIDGPRAVAAGARGFKPPRDLPDDARQLYDQRLHQIAYHPRMIRNCNFGGHCSWTNRPYIAEQLAPLIKDAEI